MFRCDACGKSTPPNTPCKKIVTRKKRHLHPERPRAQKGTAILKNGKKKMVWVPDFGGWGEQIVSEAKMCLGCAAAWEREHAAPAKV